MSSTDALTTAGRHLLSFDFTANNDHLHDFEWSASSSSFVLYSPLSCFILENFSNASRDKSASLVVDDAWEERAPLLHHREHKTTPLRRTATMHCHRLSLVWSALIDRIERERERETRLLRNIIREEERNIPDPKRDIFWRRRESSVRKRKKFFTKKN